MKAVLLFFSIIILFCSCDGGPWEIRDLPACSMMVDHHISRQNDYKKIKNNELQKTGLQGVLLREQEKLTVITNKLKKRYTTVSSIIHSVGRIPYAIAIANDCKRYQKSIIDKVIDEPKLGIIAVKTELAVIKKINKLYKFIYANAVIGTNFNLMTNEQRLQIITYVVDELRVIRGFLYGVDVQLKYAKEGEFLDRILKKFDISLFLLDNKEKNKIVKDLKVW